MTKAEAFDLVSNLIDTSDWYGNNNPDMQYMLGYFDGVRDAVKKDERT